MALRYGGSDDYTVQHVLNLMDDHILAIEEINTSEGSSPLIAIPQTQANINKAMDQFVRGLESMLTWNGQDANGEDLPPNTQPDVAGYSGNKSTYTAAITLGQAYITENT